jgi:hypothetical protein
MTAKTITDLAVLFEHATAALNACVDRGMQLPFILCAVAPNGSVAAIRTDGVEPELLADRIDNDKEIVVSGREVDLFDFNSHFLGELPRRLCPLGSVLD